jgi:glycosyltransferase involved in cell wall biosynthesis
MRVLFLTHYYPPEVGAPQTRISALAEGLARRGLDVTVHTGFPHYPDGVIRAPFRNRPLVRREEGGVRVLRSAVYPAPNSGFGRRLAGHGVLAGSALATAPAAGRQDVVVVESPPLFTAAAGAAYAALKRAPLIVNVADRWPESAVQLGLLRNRAAIAAASALERWCYRRAALITVPTAGIEAALSGLPASAGKVERVWPAVDLGRFPAPRPAAAAGPLRALYAGTVGMAQWLGTLVEAARLAGPDVVEVTVAGDGADLAALRAAAAGTPNVRLLGAVPAGDVAALYADADIGLVLLRDREIFAGALPTKLFEIMAAGRACLVAARGETAQFVVEEGIGEAVAPEDPGALAAALARLRADPQRVQRMGAAARSLAEDRFGRDVMIDRWLQLLTRVAAGP